jgi:hypothetical protein
MNIMIKQSDVALIMRSHRCSQDEAVQILIDLRMGKRVAKSGEELRKMAGCPPKPYESVPTDTLYSLTRKLSRILPETVSSVSQPVRPANRANGRRDRAEEISNAIARGVSLMPSGPPPGHTKLEKE